MFQLVGTQRLHAHLPFPESAASRLKVGQLVRLTSPLVPDFVVDAKIDEIRPTITATSRALDVIVKFDTDGKFRGGGTVNAQVVTGRKPNAIVVPEQAVVLRPAGKVVYVVEGGQGVAANRPDRLPAGRHDRGHRRSRRRRDGRGRRRGLPDQQRKRRGVQAARREVSAGVGHGPHRGAAGTEQADRPGGEGESAS